MTPPPVAEPVAPYERDPELCDEIIAEWRKDWADRLGKQPDGSVLWRVNASDIMRLVERIDAQAATLSAETAARVKAEGERDEARADAKYRTGIEASALDKIAELKARVRELEEALRQTLVAENSNARRMREAIVEARRRLAKGRALWNGPCHECDGVLDQALRADNDADAIARRTLLADGQPKPLAPEQPKG